MDYVWTLSEITAYLFKVNHLLTSGRIATIVQKRMSSGYSAQVNQKAGKLGLYYTSIGGKMYSN